MEETESLDRGMCWDEEAEWWVEEEVMEQAY